VAQETLAALALFEKALAAYRNQEWESSKQQLEVLMRDHRNTGEVLYELYLERIEHLKDNPPGDNWMVVLRLRKSEALMKLNF